MMGTKPASQGGGHLSTEFELRHPSPALLKPKRTVASGAAWVFYFSAKGGSVLWGKGRDLTPQKHPVKES